VAQNKEEGYSVDPVTREGLDDALDKLSKDIKEYVSLLIAPITKEQVEVKTILVGASKINGLVGGVRILSTHVKLIYGAMVIGFVTKLTFMFFVG